MSRKDDDAAGIGGIIRSLLGAPKLREGLKLGLLSKRWASVVGDQLASETQPLSLDETGLVVGVSNPAWGAQVRFLAEDISRRASEALDGAPVGPVRVVVRERMQNRR